MNVKETHNKPLKVPGALCTAIYEDRWVNVHPRRECAQNGLGRAYTAMCDFGRWTGGTDGMNGKYGRDTRPVCDAERNMTGYGSKSRKAVRTMPRRNGKSGMTTVKFLMEAFGKKKASEIIAEVEKKMESDIKKDNGMDIKRGIEDTEDIADTEVQ